MPFEIPNYVPPLLLRGGHANTIGTFLFRRISLPYARERVYTPDGDFLDLDTSKVGSSTAILIIHGLEGSAQSNYVKGLALMANEQGWDALALNLRGCSGEPNQSYTSYHSGKTEDLATTIAYLEEQGQYKRLFIAGFSLGGNLTLKYMGEQGEGVPAIVAAAAGISVPCDLKGSSLKLSSNWQNKPYIMRFLHSLKKKALLKKQQFPDAPFSVSDIERVTGFRDFDDLYTAPAHGFDNAEHYWESCSSKKFLSGIQRPTLLLSAADDPFLSESCFPIEEAQEHIHLHFQMPRYGGHVGFALPSWRNAWHEQQIMAFFNKFNL